MSKHSVHQLKVWLTVIQRYPVRNHVKYRGSKLRQRTNKCLFFLFDGGLQWLSDYQIISICFLTVNQLVLLNPSLWSVGSYEELFSTKTNSSISKCHLIHMTFCTWRRWNQFSFFAAQLSLVLFFRSITKALSCIWFPQMLNLPFYEQTGNCRVTISTAAIT